MRLDIKEYNSIGFYNEQEFLPGLPCVTRELKRLG